MSFRPNVHSGKSPFRKMFLWKVFFQGNVLSGRCKDTSRTYAFKVNGWILLFLLKQSTRAAPIHVKMEALALPRTVISSAVTVHPNSEGLLVEVIAYNYYSF